MPRRLLRASRSRIAVAGVLAAVLLFLAATAIADTIAVKRHGQAAAQSLESLPKEYEAQDITATAASLRTARSELSQAQGALAHPVLRVARYLPLSDTYVDDARRLVRAADVMTRLGDQLVRLHNVIDGTSGRLMWPQQIDLDTLTDASQIARQIMRDLADARGELAGVRWAPGLGSVIAQRDRARGILDDVARTARVIAAPAIIREALGATQVRRYLAVLTDGADLGRGLGRPVATAWVSADHGTLSVRPGPALPTSAGELGNAFTSSALLPEAGPAAQRWAAAVSPNAPDGVLLVTPEAVRLLLHIVGTAGVAPAAPSDVAATLAAASTPEQSARTLLVATLRRAVALQKGHDRLAAFATAAAQGQAGIFATDAKTESYIVRHGLGLTIPPGVDDVAGVEQVEGAPASQLATRHTISAHRDGEVTVDSRTSLSVSASSRLAVLMPRDANGVVVTVDGERAPVVRDRAGDASLLRLRLVPGAHVVSVRYALRRSGCSAVCTVAVVGAAASSPVSVQVAEASAEPPADRRWHSTAAGYQASLTTPGVHLLDLRPAPAGGDVKGWLVRTAAWLLVLVLLVTGARWALRRRRRPSGRHAEARPVEQRPHAAPANMHNG